MSVPVELIITILASTGFWGFIGILYSRHMDKLKEKNSKNTAEREMLLGLGYIQLMQQCEKHVENGYITVDELVDLNKYLFEPYKKLGGDGSAERIMHVVEKLPHTSPQAASE